MKNTALLIVDMQNDFVLPGSGHFVDQALSIIPNIARVLDRFRRGAAPVFHVIREYRKDGSDVEITRLDDFLGGEAFCVAGTEGCRIVEALAPVEGEYTIVKNRFSAFMNTELDFILRRLGITHVVVCGVQVPNCIRATVFDGVSLGYNVTLITDGVGAKAEEVAKANIHDIMNIGAPCLSADEFLRDFESEPKGGLKWKSR